MSPRIDLVGAYRVEVNDQIIDRAYELKYGDLELSTQDVEERRDEITEELSGLALIELIVRDRDSQFNVGDFQQPGSEQVAYDEAFLSADGTQVLSRGFEVPSAEPLRVAFFLHFFDPSRPLGTSYGPVDIPPLQAAPPRLRELMPYEPVD